MRKRRGLVTFGLWACMTAGFVFHGISDFVYAEKSTLAMVNLADGVTYECDEKGNVKFVNLHGNSVIIKDVPAEEGENVKYHNIYIDKNRNGKVDDGEEKVDLGRYMGGTDNSDIPATVPIYGIYQAKSTTPIRITVEGTGYGEVIGVNKGELVTSEEPAVFMDVNTNSIGNVVGASESTISSVKMSLKGTMSQCTGARGSIINASGAESAAITMDIDCVSIGGCYAAQSSTVTTSGTAEKVIDVHMVNGNISALYGATNCNITAGKNTEAGIALNITGGNMTACYADDASSITMSDTAKTAVDIDILEDASVGGGLYAVQGNTGSDAEITKVSGKIDVNINASERKESGYNINTGQLIYSNVAVDGAVTVTADNISANRITVAEGNVTISESLSVDIGENTSISILTSLSYSTVEKDVTIEAYGSQNSNSSNTVNAVTNAMNSRDYSVGGNLNIIHKGGNLNGLNCVMNTKVKGDVIVSILDGSLYFLNGVQRSEIGGDFRLTTGETVAFTGGSINSCAGSLVTGDYELRINNTNIEKETSLYPLDGTCKIGGDMTTVVKGGKFYYINTSSSNSQVDGNYTMEMKNLNITWRVYGLYSTIVKGNTSVAIQNVTASDMDVCNNVNGKLFGDLDVSIKQSTVTSQCNIVRGGVYAKNIKIVTEDNTFAYFYGLYSPDNIEGNITLTCTGDRQKTSGSGSFYYLYNGQSAGTVTAKITDCAAHYFYGMYNFYPMGTTDIQINGGNYTGSFQTCYNMSSRETGEIVITADNTVLGTNNGTWLFQNRIYGKSMLTCDIKDTCTINGTCDISYDAASDGAMLVMYNHNRYYAGNYPVTENVTANNLYFNYNTKMKIPKGITMSVAEDGMIYANSGVELLIEGTLKGAICQNNSYKYSYYMVNEGTLDTPTEDIYLLYYPVSLDYLEKGGTVKYASGFYKTSLCPDVLFGQAGQTVSVDCAAKKGYSFAGATVQKSSDTVPSSMAEDEKNKGIYGFDMTRETADIVITFTGNQIVLGKTVADPVAKLNEATTAKNPLYDMADVTISNDGREGTVSYAVDETYGLPEGLELVDGKIYGTPTKAYETGKKTVIHVTGKNDTVAKLTLNVIVTVGGSEQTSQDGRILVDEEKKEINLLGSPVVIEETDAQTGIYLDDNQDGVADRNTAVYQGDLSGYTIYGIKDADIKKPVKITMKSGTVGAVYGSIGSDIAVTGKDAVDIRILGGEVSGKITALDTSAITGTILFVIAPEVQYSSAVLKNSSSYTGSCQNLKGNITVDGTYTLQESMTAVNVSVISSAVCTIPDKVVLTAQETVINSKAMLYNDGTLDSAKLDVTNEVHNNGILTTTDTTMKTQAVLFNRGSFSCSGTFTNNGKLVLCGGSIVQEENEWKNVYYPITLKTGLKGIGISCADYYTMEEEENVYYFLAGGTSHYAKYRSVAGYEGYYAIDGEELVKIEDDGFNFEMPRKAAVLEVAYVPTDITLSKQFDDPVGVVGTAYTETAPLYDFDMLSIANDTTAAYGSNVRYNVKNGYTLPKGLTIKNGKLIGTPQEVNKKGQEVVITVTGRNGTSADIAFKFVIEEKGYKQANINEVVTYSGSEIDLHGHSVIIRSAKNSSTLTSIYLDENGDGIADNSSAYMLNGKTELDLSKYTVYGCRYNEEEKYDRDITIHMYGGQLQSLVGAIGKIDTRGNLEKPVKVNGNVSVYISGGSVSITTAAGYYAEAKSLNLDVTGGTFGGTNAKMYGAYYPQNVETVYFRFQGRAEASCNSSSRRLDVRVTEGGTVAGNVEAVVGVTSTYGLSGSYSYFYGVNGTEVAKDVNYTIDGDWYAGTMNIFVYNNATVKGNVNVDWQNGYVACGGSNTANCAFVRNSKVENVNVIVAEDARVSGTISMAPASTVNNLYYYSPDTVKSYVDLILFTTSFKPTIKGYGYAKNNKSIQIAGTYVINEDLEATGITVAEDAKVTIAEGVTVTNNGIATLNGLIENKGSINLKREGTTSTGFTIESTGVLINRESGNCNLGCRVENSGKIVNYGTLTQTYTKSNYGLVGNIYTATIPDLVAPLRNYSTIYYSVSLDYPEYCIDSVMLTDANGAALAASGVEGDTNQYLKGGASFKVITGEVIESICLNTITYGSSNSGAVTADGTTWTGTLGYEPTVITLNFDGNGLEPISLEKTADTIAGATVGVRSTASTPLYDMTGIQIQNDLDIAGGYVSYTVDSSAPLPKGLNLVNGKIYGTPVKASSEPQSTNIIVKGKNQTSATFVLTFDSIAKGTPSLRKPTNLSADAGAVLSTIELPEYTSPAGSEGSYRWKDGTQTVGDVGGIKKDIEVEFIPGNTQDYDWNKVADGTYTDGVVTTTLSVSVNKLKPEYEVPKGLTAKYGQTLDEIVLPSDEFGSFSWETDKTTEVGKVGEQTFYLVYTPGNTDKYKEVNHIEVVVTVQPKEVTFTPPENIHAVYGDTLADIVLPAVDGGRYQWITQSTVIPENGQSYQLGYKPDDITNYDWASVKGYSKAYRCVIFNVEIIVEPQEIELTGLPTEITVQYGKPLSDTKLPHIKDGKWYLGEDEIKEPLIPADELPNGAFEWTDGTILADTLEEMEVSVNFRPTDEEKYKYTKNIKVIVSVSHVHAYGTEWKTNTDSHWKECECGGKAQEAEHTWDAGVVTKQPTTTEAGERKLTCTICKTTKLVEEPATGGEHKHVYGDTWKADADKHWKECECGDKAQEAEHTWDAGVVTKQPTSAVAGEKTITCTVCKQTKMETVAATGGGENPGGGSSVGTVPGEVNNNVPAVGTVLDDSVTKAKYKVTGTKEGARTVTYMATTDTAATTVNILSVVEIDHISYDVTAIADNAFKNNKKLKKIVISSKILTIGNAAFSGCKKLATVTMGANVTTIGKNAFYNCTALKKIVLPKTVVKIGSKAFYGCKKLLNITIKTTKLTTKNVGSKAFTKAGSSNYKKMVVKVPKSKLKAYKKMLKKRGVHAKAKIKK